MNLADQIEQHLRTAKDLERMQKEMAVKQTNLSKFTASKREREVIIEVKHNRGQSVDGILTFDCVRLNGEKLLIEFIPSAMAEIVRCLPHNTIVQVVEPL